MSRKRPGKRERQQIKSEQKSNSVNGASLNSVELHRGTKVRLDTNSKK